MNNNTMKQASIMNNYITVLIEILCKTSNNKSKITTSEAHRVKEFQKIILI